jgi:ABC-2 type transport system permease protein
VGAVILIGFTVQGSVLDLMIFIAVGSTALISMALLVAARLASEEVADGVLNVLTWPMIFLSGIWFSLDGASPWVVAISKALPLTHIVNGVRAILLDGATLASLLPEMIALSIASAVLLAIGSLIFRWR